MDSKLEIEHLKQRIDILKKKNDAIPPANIHYKKCHDCGSDLVPPLKISNVLKLQDVEQYIICPICLGETMCKRKAISFNFG